MPHKKQDSTLSQSHPKETILAIGVACLLIFVPLFKAGNRPLPLMVIEMAAVALLIIRVWPTASPVDKRIPLWLWAAVGGTLCFYPLIYLIPLPFDLWAALPGREPYAEGLTIVNDGPPAGWHPLAIVPSSAEASWLALLPPLAIFLGAVALPSQYLLRLVIVVLAMAVFQALLGLLQFGAGSDSVLCLGNPYCGRGGAAGTYVNRDHLAGFLEMTLPVGLALLAVSMGRLQRERYRYRQSWRERLLSHTTWQAHAAQMYGAACIAILIGLVFTRSRSGLALAMLCLLFAVIAFSRRLGGSNVFGTIGTIATIAFALAVDIGLAPVLDRFAMDPLEDTRWTIFSVTLQGIGAFFPLGSGPGSYASLIRAYKPVEFGTHFINHAHNDYLEWLFEGGLLSASILLLLVAIYCRQWFKVWERGQWSTFRFIQVGAGIGLLMIALHGAVDFNWHIPANAIYTAFLAALFFHRAAPASRQEKPVEPERSASTQKPPERAKDPVPEPLPEPVPEPVNPFLE